jgi:LysR family glycine cleavage system transcriptional activator
MPLFPMRWRQSRMPQYGCAPPGRQRILKVWCMPGLASRWLTPRLSQIRQHLPDVEIVVRPTEILPDFAQVAADLMIGFGMPQSLPPHAIPLVRPRVFPVASPQFLAKHGAPATVTDLVRYPLIHEESYAQWASWFAAGHIQIGEDKLSGTRLWSANLCIDAALAGQGITLGFAPLVQDCINDGQLVELFETDIRLGGYFLAAPPGRWADPILSRFRDWIKGELV